MAWAHFAWLAEVNGSIQRFALQVATTDLRHLPTLSVRLVRSLPSVPDRSHNVFLATALLGVSYKLVEIAHATRGESCRCYSISWGYVPHFAAWHEHDPLATFVRWSRTFTRTYFDAHPPTISHVAASLIRSRCSHHWTVEDLSATLGVSRRQLTRSFHETFRIKPLEFVHLTRVSSAIELLARPTKVESVAIDMGYRSKKDFYRAVNMWTGTTPAGLRRMPNDIRDSLALALKVCCVHGLRNTGTKALRAAQAAVREYF